MKCEFRSDCPVASALDIIGDKWSLVIVRDLLIVGKKTFKDFSESEEKIATNILTSRLKHLQKYGIVTKSKPPNNKKTIVYTLTKKGISLAPIIVELILWSDLNVREFNSAMDIDEELLTGLRADTKKTVAIIQEKYTNNLKKA
jgi:DNA-binding HxlR family transcriptional regulator